MQIVIKFPDENQGTDVQPFFESSKVLTEEEKLLKQESLDMLCQLTHIKMIGYGVFGKSPMISIEKRDGYLYVEIDEKLIISIDKIE